MPAFYLILIQPEFVDIFLQQRRNLGYGTRNQQPRDGWSLMERIAFIITCPVPDVLWDWEQSRSPLDSAGLAYHGLLVPGPPKSIYGHDDLSAFD